MRRRRDGRSETRRLFISITFHKSPRRNDSREDSNQTNSKQSPTSTIVNICLFPKRIERRKSTDFRLPLWNATIEMFRSQTKECCLLARRSRPIESKRKTFLDFFRVKFNMKFSNQKNKRNRFPDDWRIPNRGSRSLVRDIEILIYNAGRKTRAMRERPSQHRKKKEEKMAFDMQRMPN